MLFRQRQQSAHEYVRKCLLCLRDRKLLFFLVDLIDSGHEAYFTAFYICNLSNESWTISKHHFKTEAIDFKGRSYFFENSEIRISR